MLYTLVIVDISGCVHSVKMASEYAAKVTLDAMKGGSEVKDIFLAYGSLC